MVRWRLPGDPYVESASSPTRAVPRVATKVELVSLNFVWSIDFLQKYSRAQRGHNKQAVLSSLPCVTHDCDTKVTNKCGPKSAYR